MGVLSPPVINLFNALSLPVIHLFSAFNPPVINLFRVSALSPPVINLFSALSPSVINLFRVGALSLPVIYSLIWPKYLTAIVSSSMAPAIVSRVMVSKSISLHIQSIPEPL